MTRIASIVASLNVGEIIELTSAHKRPLTGERVVETHRAVVRFVNAEPHPDYRGRDVVSLTYSPAWNEPAWCGHGACFAPVDGDEPVWSIIDIRRTGQVEPRQPSPWYPQPGNRGYDLMC